MVFYPPKWVPKLPNIPDDVAICDFMLDDRYGRHPLGYSLDPFTCGLSGKSYSALEVVDRVDYLARALAKEFGWQPNKGSEWDKVLAIFSVNTVRDRAFAGPDTGSMANQSVLYCNRSTHCPWRGPPTGCRALSLLPTQPTPPPS